MKFWLDPAVKPAFEHARAQTAFYSRSFYFSAKMLPKERRWATYALYGFCRYADNLIDNPRDRTHYELFDEVASVARELEIAYRTGESEHPVLGPFIIVARKYGIPIEYPLDLLEGVKMDIQFSRYQTFDDLYLFCYRVAGVVGLMMTHVLGTHSPEAFQYAEKLGIAMQLTNILRDVQEDKDMDRIYLPQQELRDFGVSEQEIFDERMSESLRELLRFQVMRAHEYYHLAEPGIPMLRRKSQFAIYSASKIYRGILRKIEARNYNPFLGRVFVPQSRKVGILMQEVLRTRVLPLQNISQPAVRVQNSLQPNA